MAIISDPSYLSQGAQTAVADAAWTSSTGSNVTITGTASLPTMEFLDYFEVRDHSVSDNNGLYRVRSVGPTTSSIDAEKITGNNPTNSGAEAIRILGDDTTKSGDNPTQKSIHIDTDLRRIHVLESANSNIDVGDGVTLQAVYSFLKEEWKDDDDLNPHPFPMIAITPEQFEFIYDWEPLDDTHTTTRKLLRTAGWQEIDTENGNKVKRKYMGAITLGTFEDSANDVAYYQTGDDPTDTTSTTDFDYAGPVNEAVLIYEENLGPDAGGNGYSFANPNGTHFTVDGFGEADWAAYGYRVGGQVTILSAEDAGNDGDWVISSVAANTLTVVGQCTPNADDRTARFARNYQNALQLFLRIRDADTNGKTFSQSDLQGIGVTELTYQAYRFPLSNATDLKITSTDATITGGSPWDQILIRYFDQPFRRAVDTAALRAFGIVIDVGTFSAVDGVQDGSNTLTTAEGGIPGSTYDGGVCVIHEGVDAGTYDIVTASGTNVELTTSLSTSNTGVSFTLQRSTPVTANAEVIYEKVQYLLRQAADIDSTDQTVTGKTADALLTFVGDNLQSGQATAALPNNPNGGGSGVIIEGFSSNDTNRLTFYDNVGSGYTYPFVAAGTISFNDNLNDAGDVSEYWMFFTYTESNTATDYTLSVASGNTANLNSGTKDLTTFKPNGSFASGDYISLSGFADANNNGVWKVTAAPTSGYVQIQKVNGDTVSNESPGTAVTVGMNPINSPAALLVQNNTVGSITGVISTSSVTFDFDYDGNQQGGRASGTGNDAAVTIRAIGLSTGQFVETTGTITRNTGLTFSLVAALERNYSNPA